MINKKHDLNLLITLKLIFHGWSNMILDLISDIKYKKYFDARYEICKTCPHNKHGICDICGCVLKAKTMSEDSECPDGKWKTIEETLRDEED